MLICVNIGKLLSKIPSVLRGIYIIRFLPAQKGSRYMPLSILVLTSKVLLLLMVLVLISNDRLFLDIHLLWLN